MKTSTNQLNVIAQANPSSRRFSGAQLQPPTPTLGSLGAGESKTRRKSPWVIFGLWPFLLTLLVPRLEAGTHVWAGGDYLWSKPGNWFSGGAPQVGEAAPVVIVLPPAGAKFSTNDIPGLKIDEIVITGNNYNLGVRNGAAFDFRGEVRGGNPMNSIYITNLTAKINGPLVLTNQCRFMGEGSTLTINGAISGSGNFYLTGPIVEFTGTQANTFSGHTFVQRNELRLNKTNAVAIAGPIYIGLDHHNPDAVVVRHLRADQIVNTADVTVYSDGVLDLNGYDDAVQDLVFYGGHVTTGAGTLFLGGNISALSSTDSAVIEGKLSVGIGQRVVHVEAGTPFDNLHIKAAVSGIAGVTKTGAGTLTLSGNNSFSSTFTINEGPVLAQSSTAFGGTLGQTVVGTNGTLVLIQPFYAAETLNLAGHGWQGLGAVHVAGVNATWTGPVMLPANAGFMVTSNSTLEISGVMSGPGGFNLTGGGELLLNGGSANTHTGTNVVSQGTLRLAKSPNVAALAGTLILGDGDGGYSADRVVLHANGVIPNTAFVQVNGTGELDLGAFSISPGGLAISATAVVRNSAGSVLTLPPLVRILANGWTHDGGWYTPGRITGTGQVLMSGPTTFDAEEDPITGLFTIHCPITGGAAATVTKVGLGDVGFGGNNTYAGLTVVKEGALLAEYASALGSAAAGTILTNQGRLWLQGTISGEPLVIATDSINPPPWNLAAHYGGVTGPIQVQTEVRVAFAGLDPAITLLGALTGPGSVTLITPPPGWGAGTLRLAGNAANNYAGGTFVRDGRLELAKTNVVAVPGPLTIGDGTGAVSSASVVLSAPEQILNLSAVQIDSDGGLDLNNFVETIGSLAGNGRVFCQTAILYVGVNDQNTVWSGGILGHGPTSLYKFGLGTLQITGDNYCSGDTVVQSGTLQVDGTLPSSRVVVNNTGKLSGTGTLGRLKNFIGGHTSPGALVGTLHSGDVEMVSPGTYRVDLAGLPPSGACDLLNVTGTVSLGNVTLVVAPTNASPVSANFTIINNDGVDAVAGTFNGLAEGAEFVAGNQRFRISYAGGDGNDVVLTRANTAPSLTSITVATPANEGSLVGLDGTISDPDLTDTFTLVVNWGDGTPAQTINLPAGTTVFHSDHFYADDKPGAQPSDNFLIEYTLTDSAGSPAFGQLSTVIGNVAPSFPKFSSIGLKPGEALVTTLTFDDPGSDTWIATVNYGDGTGTQPLAVGANKGLSLSHTFPTNGIYSVALTVSDDDTGSGDGTLLVYVGYALTITETGPQQATLAWPGVFENAAPYRTTSVNSTNWTEVQGTRSLIGGEWKQVVSTTNAMEFFRLGESGSQ